MDAFTPFTEIGFESLTFNPTKFEEYSNGRLISSGYTDMTIFAKTESDGQIHLFLVENSIENKISSHFVFDTTLTLNDRLQLTILPEQTNVEDVTFQMLRHNIKPTRKSKDFTPLEPIVGHMFTENMTVVKMSFKMTNPVRLIELF